VRTGARTGPPRVKGFKRVPRATAFEIFRRLLEWAKFQGWRFRITREYGHAGVSMLLWPALQGYLAHEKTPTPLGTPLGPLSIGLL